jgi:hypothetical protein
MKLSFLREIVQNYANNLEINAGYSGSWGDGGKRNLIERLKEYEQRFIIVYDLRPSEFHKLDDIEVDEPSEFNEVIMAYKMELAKKIKL